MNPVHDPTILPQVTPPYCREDNTRWSSPACAVRHNHPMASVLHRARRMQRPDN
jgi:hypothetical protein